jgi:hypothetical protein
LSGISIPKKYGDIWEFGVHPILLNPLKYSSPKILYHDEALFTSRYLRGWKGIILYSEIFPIGCLLVRVLRG